MATPNPAGGPDSGALDAPAAKRLVRDGYDRASEAYRGDAYTLDGSGYAHWLGQLERRLAPAARVLDLGCGNGLPVCRVLAERHDVTGVDLSPVQVERAAALVPRARFACADMATVAFPPASFDAVTAFWSVINLPLAEQPGLFRRIADWLVPGGWLLAVVGRRARTVVEQDWRGVKGANMFWSYADIERYRDWLAAAGFAIEVEGEQPRGGRPGFAVVIARREERA